MTKFYAAQMKEVLDGTAEEFPAPAVAIHPRWETNGVYHDIFFAPFDVPMFWVYDVCAVQEMEMAQWREMRANCVKPIIL